MGPNKFLIIGGLMATCFVLMRYWRRTRIKARAEKIESFVFPAAISRKVREAYPHLENAQVEKIMEALRDFFAIALLSKGRMISMPSKAVDVAWHEFILFTRGYEKFCRESLGYFLHHTPAEAMRSPTVAQDGIKRVWKLACKRENIDPVRPTRLPRLFAIDATFAITDGYKYSLDCSVNSDTFCASNIGCGSGCGGSSCGAMGFFGGDGDSGSGSDGCGGNGGCGGGCGGGGD